MVQILERHGLSFGKDTNAETNFKQTVYMLELPKNDVETLKTSLFIMRETASELTLIKRQLSVNYPLSPRRFVRGRRSILTCSMTGLALFYETAMS